MCAEKSTSDFAFTAFSDALSVAEDKNITGVTVPHNSDVEAGLIGAVLRDNDFYHDIPYVTAEMFYLPAHQKLWHIIGEAINVGNTATPVTLKHRADKIPEIEALGGGVYLARLTFEEFSVISPVRYAEILRDLYQKRQIIHICQDSINMAYDVEDSQDADQICNTTEQRLFNLQVDPTRDDLHSLSKASESALEVITQIYEKKVDPGVNSGFVCLNNVMGGLKPSDLIILAARPAMGKTALALNIAVNAAEDFRKKDIEKSVLFFSLEMSAQQLSMRVLSDKADITHEKLRLGNLTSKDYDNYRQAAKKISTLPLFIEGNPNITIAEMRSAIRRLSRKNPVGVVFLDYLQLLNGSRSSRRNDNRVQELSEITRGLKLLAREFDIPVFVLSQLSRQVETREDKTPKLADLRESGSIEQDADVVMFIYRPEYYLKPPEPEPEEPTEAFERRQEAFEKHQKDVKGVAKIIIAKNRHGSPTAVEMMFYEQLIRFADTPHRGYQNAHGVPNE